MAEYANPNAITQWLPMIGTLAGATIGFVGVLISLWFTQKNREKSEQENRERARIEDLYEILIEVRVSYQKTLGGMIKKVMYSTIENEKENTGIPPLIKLEMLMHMYFPNLDDEYQQFIKAKNLFGEQLAKNLTTSFNSESHETKKAINSQYLNAYNELDNKISAIQKKLASIIKP